MGDELNPLEQVAFLARSETRVRVLEQLSESGATTRRELEEGVDASRSTVARTLDALEQRCWIEKTGGAYDLTPTGEIVVEEFLALTDAIRLTGRLSTFLNWFPHSEFDIDPRRLRDAEITSSDASNPYAPGREQTEFVRSATRFRALLPSIDLEGTKVVHEQIVAGELDAEIVVSSDVGRTIHSGEYAPLFREKVRTGRLRVFVHDGELPFYLGLADHGSVQIGVEDDEGFPRALLTSSEPSVNEWATDTYEEYRARSRVEPADAF